MADAARPTSPQSPASSSFPQPFDTSDHHAPSVISSRMTDIASEDGEGGGIQQTQRSAHAVLGVTGPVGEPGLPPSRPSSTATGVTGVSSRHGGWSQHNARRGLMPAMHKASGSPATGNTRPSSSASKTHVPSLASHAFFRPMSSQRLQAQRGQRPSSLVSQNFQSTDGHSDAASTANRQSNGSYPIVRSGTPLGGFPEIDALPPPSRGTDFTERDIPDRTTANTTPTEPHTMRSRGESVTPLHKPKDRPSHLNLDQAYKGGQAPLPTPQKSPRSFRSSFMMPSRGGSGTMRPQGHEKLSSAASSPRRLGSAGDPMKSMAPKKDIGRNYEYFTGNTVFCWGGRLQNARDRPVNIATGLLVVLPSGLFLGFSAPWLWLNVSPAIPIVFAYLFLICISSYVHASVTDPGILPRNLHPFPPSQPNEDPLTIGPATTDWTLVKSYTTDSQAMEVPTKYCKSCNIWRPPRGHHCRVCNNCIETQDHHCIWLNNCVGRRNYRYFFTFVSSGTLLGAYLLAASLAHVLVWRARHQVSFGTAINQLRVPFAMFIYAVLITPYPASLWGYHLFLIARGETTREYLNSHKFEKEDRHKPFTQGSVWKNWAAVLARPRPPTYLNFKRRYEEGDQRFGERRGNRTAPLASDQQGGGGLEMQEVHGSTVPSFQGPSSRGLLGQAALREGELPR